jgi:hypothetical protein
MRPLIPYNYINLVGDGIMRGVTIVLPTAEVQGLLPHGLELGEQDLTPRGTHPIILSFYDMLRVHMSIPTLLPNMTYREQILGVPYAYVSPGYMGSGSAGPFFFMPRLNLTNYLATLGGVLFWGFDKELASISVTMDRYAVSGPGGEPMLSLDFEPSGDYRPITHYTRFKPIYDILCQPLISQVPLAIGPWFAASMFEKKWSTAELQPLSTVVRIEQAFVPSLPCGRFPAEGRAVGIDQHSLGSYVLKMRWRTSLIYPPSLHAQPFSR